MKGNTIASRAKRRMELNGQDSTPLDSQISEWMTATSENIAYLAGEIKRSKLPRHTPWKVIEEYKAGKKTGLIALARVT